MVFARNEPSQSSHKYVLLRFGGENHLKAAIALLVNKQSATFPLREKSGFSPPPPSEISTQWKFVICRGTRQIFSHLAWAASRKPKLQARTSRKQRDQQPNDVRTEFRGCLLKLKISTVPFRSRAELAKRSNLRAVETV